MPLSRPREYGLLTSRLFVEMARSISEEFFLTSGERAPPDLLLLGAALYIGQLEGRMMTASKISIYIGIPRPSVIRKLQAMREAGIAAQDHAKRWRLATENPAVKARANAIMLRHVALMRKASTELSRLDTVAIARRK